MRRLQSLFARLSGGRMHHDGQRGYETRENVVERLPGKNVARGNEADSAASVKLPGSSRRKEALTFRAGKFEPPHVGC